MHDLVQDVIFSLALPFTVHQDHPVPDLAEKKRKKEKKNGHASARRGGRFPRKVGYRYEMGAGKAGVYGLVQIVDISKTRGMGGKCRRDRDTRSLSKKTRRWRAFFLIAESTHVHRSMFYYCRTTTNLKPPSCAARGTVLRGITALGAKYVRCSPLGQ